MMKTPRPERGMPGADCQETAMVLLPSQVFYPAIAPYAAM